jgi:hypothetical protein
MRASIVIMMTLASSAHAEKLYEEIDKPRYAKCAGPGWCVIEYDFTYMVVSNASRKAYMVDYGSPEAPVVKGTTSKQQVRERAVATLREVLATKLKLKRAQVHCEVATRLPALLGLGETVDITLAPSTAHPLAKLAAKDVNARWASAAGNPDDTTSEVFGAAELAKMTATTFANPTLVVPRRWRTNQSCQGNKCTEEVTTDTALYVLYSPESADAYVFDGSLELPTKQYKRKLAPTRAAARAAIAATAASLGHKAIALRTASMCGLDLLPNKGWFDWKP